MEFIAARPANFVTLRMILYRPSIYALRGMPRKQDSHEETSFTFYFLWDICCCTDADRGADAGCRLLQSGCAGTRLRFLDLGSIQYGQGIHSDRGFST